MAKSVYEMNDRELAYYAKQLKSKVSSEDRHIDDLEGKLATQLPNLSAGNLDDINKIIWPFLFTSSELNTPAIEIAPNSSTSAFVNVTQEAGFVFTEFTKVVFEKIDLGGGAFDYRYVNPKDISDDGIASGLSYTFSDSQSTRSFMQAPLSTDNVGDAFDPSYLKNPMFILPNSSMEVKFYNDHPTRTYIPFINFNGYRVRVEDAREILGLVNR